MIPKDENKPTERTPERADQKQPRPVFEPQTQDETSGVSAFFGTWPGDETDAELLVALDEIDD